MNEYVEILQSDVDLIIEQLQSFMYADYHSANTSRSFEEYSNIFYKDTVNLINRLSQA